MSGPDYVQYFGMVLDALRDMQSSGSPAEVSDWIAKSLEKQGKSVPEGEFPSGAPKFETKIAWARYYLVKGGFLHPMAVSGYGTWRLTQKGFDTKLSDDDAFSLYKELSKKPKSSQQNGSASTEGPADDQESLPGLESWQQTVIKTLTTLPATGFERLCAFIMRESGFEGVTTTKASGDGGIDGIGTLTINGLALISVAFQAKRYKDGKVGSSVVRDFRGSMDGRTQYGFIVTTSSFTQDAKSEARRPGAIPIELIDGQRLCKLMSEKEIGLRPKVITTYEVDETFFDQYMTARDGGSDFFPE